MSPPPSPSSQPSAISASLAPAVPAADESWPGESRLWPSQCEVCRRWSNRLLCRSCVARWAVPRVRCARCGLALAHATPAPAAPRACAACAAAPPSFEFTLCAVDYAPPWVDLIGAMKYQHRFELAAPLATLLARAVQAQAGLPRPDLVVPVPLSRERLRERGGNQAWELARAVAARLRLPASASCLHRVMDTPHQAGLNRAERERNLRSAFVPASALDAPTLRGARVALVDDVMTTAATAREATGALLRGGAAAVQVWVVARTAAPAQG